MKKLLYALLMTVALSALAFGGPMVSPYFEIENVGIDAAPTFEAGVLLEADISNDWSMELSGFYFDNNILNANNKFDLGFDSSVSFDQTLLFEGGGWLNVGASMSIGSVSTFKTNAYPEQLKLKERTSGFLLEGYVGPLSLWGGVDFPWDGDQWLDIVPTLGIRVEFNIPLAKPASI